jgi:hypothetical protein
MSSMGYCDGMSFLQPLKYRAALLVPVGAILVYLSKWIRLFYKGTSHEGVAANLGVLCALEARV